MTGNLENFWELNRTLIAAPARLIPLPLPAGLVAVFSVTLPRSFVTAAVAGDLVGRCNTLRELASMDRKLNPAPGV